MSQQQPDVYTQEDIYIYRESDPRCLVSMTDSRTRSALLRSRSQLLNDDIALSGPINGAYTITWWEDGIGPCSTSRYGLEATMSIFESLVVNNRQCGGKTAIYTACQA